MTGRAADCAKGTRHIQDADPGADLPDAGPQSDADCRGTGAIPHRVARLLRLLPDPSSAHQPGGVDPPKIAFVSLAAVGEWAQPLQRTAPPWRIAVQGSGCRRFTDRILAHVRTSGRPSGPAPPLLRPNRSPPTLCSGVGLSRSNRRGTRPVRPVVWEGRHREVPPYPDQSATSHPVWIASERGNLDSPQGRELRTGPSRLSGSTAR